MCEFVQRSMKSEHKIVGERGSFVDGMLIQSKGLNLNFLYCIKTFICKAYC